nr:MAG TPA: hypothetical protein [Caudoviricetes sp.]
MVCSHFYYIVHICGCQYIFKIMYHFCELCVKIFISICLR